MDSGSNLPGGQPPSPSMAMRLKSLAWWQVVLAPLWICVFYGIWARTDLGMMIAFGSMMSLMAAALIYRVFPHRFEALYWRTIPPVFDWKSPQPRHLQAPGCVVGGLLLAPLLGDVVDGVMLFWHRHFAEQPRGTGNAPADQGDE
jgi:hypothetical protein